MESEPSSRPVKMMTIESPAAEVERKFPAVARAGDRSDLSFRVSGTITEIAAVEGKEFSAGDVLARLDPRDFENRVAEAKSTLAGAEADLALLKAGSRAEDIALLEAQLAAASARAAQSQSDFNRQKQMYERGLIAKSEFEVSETTFTVASREMESASQQLAKARSGARPEEIQSAEARVESVRVKVREAEAALDDTFLRAPFDGLVGTVYVDQFQEIQGKQAVLSFQNIGGIELELQVPESLVLQRRAGGTHTFEVAFAGDTSKSYPAELRQFSTEADTVTQTYRLTLGMDAPPDLNVFPGMTAEVTVKVSGLDAGKAPLLVPVESVGAATDGSATIWLIDTQSMQVHSKPVKTGRLTGDSIEVLEGLQPGDTIATAGVSQLRDGMAVRPIGQ
ncbi:MAG: efflux RND transporter periplasmic adaptor subunit [Candidatus Hydrogenedentes bacterium]|nr:efflux RND transporter periplasmic adaptor subunit [Candidatus Hydrogenedentota bacterium]